MLAKIGEGTYSDVFKGRDLLNGKVVALKKVRFHMLEPESVRFMAREIIILRRLNHPNVIRLLGLVISIESGTLYLVFEYMDHDLSKILSASKAGLTIPQVKCYLLQILKGLEYCHTHGVLHRDIKGSNLLLDGNGNLKIADFGLATFFQPNKKQRFTTRVVTLWYRPPELLLGATEYGIGIDLWSVGCVFGELFTRKPILCGKTEVEQLHKIFKLCGSPSEEYWMKHRLSYAFKPQRPYKRSLAEAFKGLPQTAFQLLDVLLAIDPDARGSATSALESDFFKSLPFACDRSSLPKFIPSTSNMKGQSAKEKGGTAAARIILDSDTKTVEHKRVYHDAQHANGESTSKNERSLLHSSGVQSGSRSERFPSQARIISQKMVAETTKQKGRERNRVYALSPQRGNCNDGKMEEENVSLLKKAVIINHHGPSQRCQSQQESDGPSITKSLLKDHIREESQSKKYEPKSKEKSSLKSQITNNIDVSRATQRRHGFDDVDLMMQHHKAKTEKGSRASTSSSSRKMQYSGLLVQPGNIERVMHEREHQIQTALRARQEKQKYKTAMESEHALLLQHL